MPHHYRRDDRLCGHFNPINTKDHDKIMGRPKLEIDGKQVAKLAGLGCSNKEIAAFFDCHPDTVVDRFSDFLVKGRENGKTRLRRAQWKAATEGSVPMLIWLGKQYLGQTDKVESKNEVRGKIETFEVVVPDGNGNRNQGTEVE